ncbi:hypothetical protein PG999_011145 [Apiospora kogelbergensis]|uniref:Uncharacterized protein n=1 Tax=Apiospora kogelbergensis TaxID=1337665 RepID=A0AAW0QEJ3_9PEZI
MVSHRHMEIQYQPFLKYEGFTDDPILVEASPRTQPRQPGPPRAPYCQYRMLSIHVASHIMVIIMTSLFWVLVVPGLPASDDQQQHRVNITTGAKYLTCGNSTKEAKSRSCRFDVLLNNWVPAPCYDVDFIAEYEEDGSSSAYRDAALTQRIELGGEALGALEFYYTSRRDHVNHCAVMWRKQFANLFERRAAFDSVIADPFHTEHCSQYLLDAPGMAMKGGEVESTKTFVGFAGCWVRDEYGAK